MVTASGCSFFYRPAGGDHRGYRPGNVWHQLMIQLSDHADPHGAAAACELEIRLCVNVPVKLQRLLQRQQVREEGHLHHPGEAQQLESRAQPARRHHSGELAQEGRGDQGVDGPFGMLDCVQGRQHVPAGSQVSRLAGLDTGAASGAAVRVHGKRTVVPAHDGVKQAGGGAVCLLFGTGAGVERPDQGVVLRVEQAVQMPGTGLQIICLDGALLNSLLQHSAVKFLKGHGGPPLLSIQWSVCPFWEQANPFPCCFPIISQRDSAVIPIPRETGQRKRENPLDRSPGRRYDKEVSTAGRLGSAHTEIKHLPRVGQSSEDLISCIGEKLPGTS